VQLGQRHRIEIDTGQQRLDNARIGHVHTEPLHLRGFQAFQRQRQHFEVGLQPGMAIDFGAELQRLAGGMGLAGPGVQHRAAIAQAGHALPVEQVRIDTGHLRRGVGPQAHHAARELVDQLEGLQIQRFAGAGEQRLQMFQQRRHHQLVAKAAGGVEQFAAEFFDVPGAGWQHIGKVIRQDPGGHKSGGGWLKRDFTGMREAGPQKRGESQASSQMVSKPMAILPSPKNRI